jgi:phospholipid/cholesterol/gamma-HCH transport system ATP-binding protein
MSPGEASREPVIVVEELTARYGDNTVLEGVSFKVYRGERFLILGASGCGKSTLLRHMLGLERPASGRVTIAGVEIGRAGEEELERLRLRLGMLFQSGALFGSMTLFDNVAMPLREHTGLPEPVIRDIVRMKLGMVELSGFDNHMPAELSGGMSKRGGIARAMAMDPEILFLDEPSAALDPVTAAELDRLIEEINEGMGTTMVIVTQDLASVLEIGSRCIVIDQREKGIIAQGDPRRLKEEATDERVLGFFNRRPLQERDGELR